MSGMATALAAFVVFCASGAVLVKCASDLAVKRAHKEMQTAYEEFDKLFKIRGEMPDGTSVVCMKTGIEHQEAITRLRASFGRQTLWMAAYPPKPRTPIAQDGDDQ